MTSTATSNVEMKLIEFASSKSITFPCQVDGKTQAEEAYYDIILGSDFMEALGIDIRYSQHCITWDGETIPLKAAGTFSDKDMREAVYFAHTQSSLLQEVEARHQHILDADYSKVDLDAMVDELNMLQFSSMALLKIQMSLECLINQTVTRDGPFSFQFESTKCGIVESRLSLPSKL